MDKLISSWEHFDSIVEDLNLPTDKPFIKYFLNKLDDQDCRCLIITPDNHGHRIKLSYFIGIDWIQKQCQAIYVAPKLNKGSSQTDYLRMLFSSLKHPDVAKYIDELFEIKFDDPYIEIDQRQDLLTPLLVVEFLRIVKEIVRKGLKKSYYKVEKNLYGRVKGKIIVGNTIKQNVLKIKPLYTYCSYDEFGLNGLENRLLKKALIFVQRYLPTLKIPNSAIYTTDILNYILPSFDNVSCEVNLNDLKHSKTNVFYKEYKEAIHLAKLILKRFGYNITNTQQQHSIKTPPFWIDMSKLFELYVLGLLKDRANNKILYGRKEAKGNYGLPDFLLVKEEEKMIIDAKYKPIYQEGKYDIDNIRQLSGYARDSKILKKLEVDIHTMIDCLIIYPDQDNGNLDLKEVDFKQYEIEQFVQFYKVAVKLPVL